MEQPVVLPIKLQPSNLRPLAYRILSKKHGLNIKSDALGTLADYIGPKFGVDWRSAKSQLLLEEIAKIWKEQERGLFLEAEGLSDVLKEIDILETKSKGSHQQQQVSIESMMISKATRADTIVDVDMIGDQQQTTPATSVTPPPLKDSLDWKEYFRLINAFEQPLFRYNPISKTYEPSKVMDAKFSGSSVQANVSLFQSRYNIVKDRVMRNENFESGTFSAFSSVEMAEKNNVISMIKNLLGRNNQRFLLLGMLTYLNGSWYLQDTSDKIKLNIDQTEPNPGSYYVSGNIVLCEGIYSSSTFYVNSIAQPPTERRTETLEAIGNIDFLGIHANMRIDKELQTRLKLVEREHDHKIIVLGSDIFLDDLRTLDALGKLFQKLSEDEGNIPISIIFNGSFTSIPKPLSEYKSLFDSLASVLEQYPVIHGNVSLVFIPGENDHWQTPVWPRQRIPKLFGNRLNRVARSVQWASNPTRMVYLSQEIVIARDDIGSRFRRNCLRFPQLDKGNKVMAQTEIQRIEALPPRISEARKIVKTLLDQGHLTPFTKDLKPVMWHVDHTLQLSPLPNVLILADSTAPLFDVTYNGCRCINPGVFIQKRMLNYIEYSLTSRKAEVRDLYF
jgi:DNA polymerase epsilon subunit 2